MKLFTYTWQFLNHLHPLQIENCDSNLRLVVDEDENAKFGLKRVKCLLCSIIKQYFSFVYCTKDFIIFNPLSAEILPYKP